MAAQGEAAIRATLPGIRDDQVKRLVQEFQKQARIAFFGQDFEPTAQAVRAAREAHEAANVRIGKVLQSL